VNPDLKAGLLIAIGLLAVIIVMVLLARWARTGSKGAVLSGALLSMFAPDPELEKNIRLANEARQEQHEEDEEGQDRDPPSEN
jgi:hypothetical protein